MKERTPFKLSKTVRPGMLVVKRGDKYIRYGRFARGPVGIYQDASSLTIDGIDGITRHEIPRGVVLAGRTNVITTQHKEHK